jgi:sugar lactone lactonase YvrE
MDAEGFIWNGHWDGWKLTRYNPNGQIERQVVFPVQHVISFAFGGKDMNQLFVTTSSWDFGEEERKQQPWGGDLFQIDTGIIGLVEPAFAG